MGYRGALNRVHALYDAWNARRWEDYAEIFSDDLRAYPSGAGICLDKPAHLALERHFCERFPDSRVETDPHLTFFGNPDGDRICVVSRLVGTRPDGPAGRRGFEITVAIVYLWRGRQVTEHRQFVNWNGPPLMMLAPGDAGQP